MATILVIEDDHDLRVTLKRMLENNGYTVLDAENGRHGLHICSTIAVDLIVTDIFMPEVEGLQTIMSVHDKYPQIKIIAISGGGDMQYKEILSSTIDFGADLFFEKPVDMDVLLDAIQGLIKP